MELTKRIIDTLPDGRVLELRIGLHWTVAVVDVEGERRCGLASTLARPHGHNRGPNVPEAGQLETYGGLELAAGAFSERPTMASVGTAVINALIPKKPDLWGERHAEDVLAEQGADRAVALVGRFPFIPRLRKCVENLMVLEKNPRTGEFPSSAAPEILPQADVVAITGMAMTNRTLERLLDYCPPEALVILLGPSTPLSPVLFDFGVDLLSGAVVTNIEAVLQAVSQGANFRQVHKAGAKLVTISREDFN